MFPVMNVKTKIPYMFQRRRKKWCSLSDRYFKAAVALCIDITTYLIYYWVKYLAGKL